jgi:hypothetical protein
MGRAANEATAVNTFAGLHSPRKVKRDEPPAIDIHLMRTLP